MLRKDPFITGQIYHIYNRGIDKRVIFKSESDYKRFIMLLYLANSDSSFRLDNILHNQNKSYFEIFDIEKNKSLVSIMVWCLMPNHFHLIIRQNIDGGITKFMKKLGTAYSMFFNIKYERKGALFGGLFKSKIIIEDEYLRHLFAYIHLNPLEIKFKDWENDLINIPKNNINNFLKLYKYSSYQDYTGYDRVEKSILNKDDFPNYFIKIKTPEKFIDEYLNIKT